MCKMKIYKMYVIKLKLLTNINHISIRRAMAIHPCQITDN